MCDHIVGLREREATAAKAVQTALPPKLAPIGEPAPGETVKARTVAEPNLLPEWRAEAEQLRQAAKPIDPVEPSEPTPRRYKATRDALEERAAIEGWTADKNPGWSGTLNRKWRKGRYV